MTTIFRIRQHALEQQLAHIWEEVLDIHPVSVRDNFFDLGGHSLLAVGLMARIQQRFGKKLPLAILFQGATIEQLAELLRQQTEKRHTTKWDNLEDSSVSINVKDLNAFAVLPPDICPEAVPVEPVTQPSRIFLTGATGFLGAFLLDELLRRTEAQIYCLVRSKNAAEGMQRIQRTLEGYCLWNDGLSERIIPVPGDLSKPHLGLSSEQFQTIASQVDVIYHNGAGVNWVLPYYALEATNVRGTMEVLRLARQIKGKPVHFISTLAVFPSGKGFREQDTLDHNECLYGGYAQSKWVAEKLVTIARERELPVCIYRPAIVTGHRQTGVFNTDSYLENMIKGCIQLKSTPSLDTIVDMVPVDYMSKAIVQLSKQPESLGKVFHVTNPNPIHSSELFDWIHAFGYPLRRVPYDTWTEELCGAEAFQENALSPFWEFLADLRAHQLNMPQHDAKNTRAGLSGTSIVCPPVDELLSTYFSYYIRSGFLDAPPRGLQQYLED
ncbi:thioester reductase domain-containing protein [Candidatus Poribacteria bacterium]|nr:thioester reductase domain-containing protein [Candidatus Poribacteria bacterium]